LHWCISLAYTMFLWNWGDGKWQLPTWLRAWHSTCWTSTQKSYTISNTPCHGTWKSVPLIAHLSPTWECRASQIETHICILRSTTHRFIWRQQQKCGALDGSPMEYGMVGEHLCGAEEQTVDMLSFPSNPSTALWSTWPDGSGWWDNRMAAQHLARDLVRLSCGLAQMMMKITHPLVISVLTDIHGLQYIVPVLGCELASHSGEGEAGNVWQIFLGLYSWESRTVRVLRRAAQLLR